MTLDERIAKRKADGWTCVGYIRRRSDGMYCTGGVHGLSADRNRAAVYERPALELMPRWREFCVWRRTIKGARGHSFSWALARMKEGKAVRRKSWARTVLSLKLTEFYFHFDGGAVATKPVVTETFLLAEDWELAE